MTEYLTLIDGENRFGRCACGARFVKKEDKIWGTKLWCENRHAKDLVNNPRSRTRAAEQFTTVAGVPVRVRTGPLTDDKRVRVRTPLGLRLRVAAWKFFTAVAAAGRTMDRRGTDG